MKKSLTIALALVFSVVMYIAALPFQVEAKMTFVTIGTGGITGVYYPTGGAIAKIVNKKRKEYGIRCTVESTGRLRVQRQCVMAGDLEFGVVQSDRQYQAVHGSKGSEWEGNPQPDLRAVFTIHPETVTLVAAVDSGIKTIADLKEKRVNIGNPGSGQRQNSIDALTAVGLDYEKDLTAEGIKASESAGSAPGQQNRCFFLYCGPSQWFL